MIGINVGTPDQTNKGGASHQISSNGVSLSFPFSYYRHPGYKTYFFIFQEFTAINQPFNPKCPIIP